MASDTLLRIAALCVLLASAETLHGIVRTVLVTPRIGKARALPLSALTGTLLAAAICWWWVPGIGLHSAGAHLALGVGLAAFMASFDLALGRWLLHKPWSKVLRDFDPSTGNYLSFGLVALAFIPWGVWWSRQT